MNGSPRLAALLLAVALVVVIGAAAGVGVARAHTAPVHVEYDLRIGACPGFEDALGCANPPLRDRPAVIWLLDPDDRLTLEHERGHVYDWTSLRPRYRTRFKRIFGLLGIGWQEWINAGFAPQEWFAEAYARCAAHFPTGFASAYGYNPTRRQHLSACRTIWTADKNRSGV